MKSLRILCLFSLISSQLFARPLSGNIVYQYYPIYAKNYHSLISQLNNRGPKGYHAYTSWNINWKYNYSNRLGGCQLKDIAVDLRIKITFPKWQNKAHAPHALQTEWLRYRKALMTHELGHAQFGIDASKKIRQSLKNMNANSGINCNALGTKASKKAYAILRKYQHKEKSYDAETEHGKTQGARIHRPN